MRRKTNFSDVWGRKEEERKEVKEIIIGSHIFFHGNDLV